ILFFNMNKFTWDKDVVGEITRVGEDIMLPLSEPAEVRDPGGPRKFAIELGLSPNEFVSSSDPIEFELSLARACGLPLDKCDESDGDEEVEFAGEINRVGK